MKPNQKLSAAENGERETVAGHREQTGNAIESGQHLSGFRVESVSDVPDAGGRLWKMAHEKSGAALFWLEREDETKTFAIAFKTLPEDDTGIAHILEHSVLEGSEKYPVKSPFTELSKSSMQVFQNAWTMPDATCYPFSTRNDTDFLNLADVYLDAVFHPLVLKDPLAFRQEGWHYERDGATGELSVNGVVFNEMKGNYASPDQLAVRETMRALSPGTVYGHDSGGNPERIPELTHEAFCAFHRRFYHPSNTLVFLDGNVPLRDILEKLDACLSAYDRRDAVDDIPLQGEVDDKVRIPYESVAGGSKAIFVQGWIMGPAVDPPHQILLANLLSAYLCGSNEAPLKKALLEKGLCKEVSMFPRWGRQIPLFLKLKDMAEEDLDACRKTIREVLGEICARGFDRGRLDALTNLQEFLDRELDTGNPKGIAHLFSMLCWFYGGEPREALALTDIYAKVRAEAEEGLFERLVRERLLESRQHAEVILVPDADLGRRRREEWAARMARLRDGMTPEQTAAIAEETAALEARQRRPNSPEEIALIPRLRSADLPPNGIPVRGGMEEKEGITRIRIPATAAGICYAKLFFPMDGFGAEELLRMPLFARLQGALRTAGRTALELQAAVAADIGRLEFSTLSAKRGRFFTVDMAVLPAKAEVAFGLLKDILFETQYGKTAEIVAILRQSQLGAEQAAIRNGCALAFSRARRGLSEKWAVSDLLKGERQLRWLQGTRAEAELSPWFAGVPERLFRRDGLIVSHTDNLPQEVLDGFLGGLAGGGALPRVRIDPIQGGAKGFALDGDTGFGAWVARLPDGMASTGAMQVGAHALSLECLHNEVREIGGAYGVDLWVAPEGVVHCSLYRDPNPLHSFDAVARSGRALREYVESGADFDRHIVASVAGMEPYRSAADEAARAANLFVEGRSGEDEERIRREMLATTREQLLEFADILEAIAPSAQTCIVGGNRQLADIPPDDIERVLPLR